MDEPQEEFIEPYASTVESDEGLGSELLHASLSERWTERSRKTD